MNSIGYERGCHGKFPNLKFLRCNPVRPLGRCASRKEFWSDSNGLLLRSRAPGPMRVAHSAPDQIDIRGRDAMRAPLLLGLAVVLAVGLAFFGTAEAASSSHVTAWSVVGLGGLLAIFLGWPRARRITLKRGNGVVHVDGAAEPIEETELRLSAVRAEGTAAVNYYAVVLRSARAGTVLLSDARPDQVLRDLALVRRVVPLRLAPGWGLPPDSPWIEPGDATTSAARRPSDAALAPSRRTKRSIAGTILVGSAGVSAIVVIDVWHRIALGDSPSGLSLALPVLFITMLVVIALGIWTSRTSFTLGTDLLFTRHVLGYAIEQRSVPRSSIRAGYLVSPDGGTPTHLLLDTEGGPTAFPCSPGDGGRVLAELYGGGPKISSAPPTQSRE